MSTDDRVLLEAAARDRPTDEPGGCECMECGAIFIGAEWHAVCGVCFRAAAAMATSAQEAK